MNRRLRLSCAVYKIRQKGHREHEGKGGGGGGGGEGKSMRKEEEGIIM